MLFTAPAFMFVFLPLSLLFCIIFGKHRKRLCLAVVCAVFYVMLNVHDPVNIVWLPLLVTYAFFSGQLAVLHKKRVIGVLEGLVPIIWLLLMRALAYISPEGFVYPVGITLPALCTAAYIWDCTYEDNAETNFGKLWLYLTFFPVMIIGPFLNYKRFCTLTGVEQINITLERCSSGISLFAVGFVKRIGVGAVLIEGYSKIFSYSWESPDFMIILLLLVLIYFGVFFSVSGYYDMAVGISRMLGVDIPSVKANPLKVATMNEYSRTLFGGVRQWSDNYIVKPLSRVRGRSIPNFCKIFLYCLCTVLFIRTDMNTLMLVIPLAVCSLVSHALKLDKTYRGGRAGIRVLFGVVTVMAVGAFWGLVTMSTITPTVLAYLEDLISGNAEYQTDLVLISFSPVKYTFVIAMALLLLLPRTSWVIRKYESASERSRAVVDTVSLAVLLLMFIFTVMFFLPQFERYNELPFAYILI